MALKIRRSDDKLQLKVYAPLGHSLVPKLLTSFTNGSKYHFFHEFSHFLGIVVIEIL